MCVDVQVAGIKCIVFLDTIAPDHADHQVKGIVQSFKDTMCRWANPSSALFIC